MLASRVVTQESPARCALDTLGAGAAGRVSDVVGDARDSLALRRLGLCAGRRVAVVRAGDPMIVTVCGSRLGLARRLAACVAVEPCPACHADEETNA